MTTWPSQDPRDPRVAAERAAGDRRLTWTIGGAALLGYALIPAITRPLNIAGSGYIGEVLFTGALVLFAVGIRGSGSVTDRRPLGTGALIALGALSLLSVVAGPMFVDVAIDPQGVPRGWWWVTGYVQTALTLLLAIIVVVQIARAHALPRPWNWAPLWAFAAMTITTVLVQVAGVTDGTDQQLLLALFGWAGVVQVAAYCFLGIAAIVLGQRHPTVDVVEVYRGAPDAD